MGVSPLAVALAAGALLVLVIGADASVNVSYALDLQQEGAWRQVAMRPYSHESAPYPLGAPGEMEVNRSDELRLRLRMENGYLWAKSVEYEVHVAGRPVDALAGRLEAGARDGAAVEFAVPAERILGRASDPEKGVPSSGSIVVLVDGEPLEAYLSLREVSR